MMLLGFVLLLIIFTCSALAMSQTRIPPQQEGFNMNLRIKAIPADGIIPDGYYIVDNINMAALPSGSTASPLPMSGSVPNGYYIVNVGGIDLMAQVPDGYTTTLDKRQLIQNKTTYDSNNYNVQYHDNLDDLNAQSGIYNNTFGNTYVRGVNGNIIEIPTQRNQIYPTYYQPGSFLYGASSYIPSYEDSVFFSKLTGQSTTRPIYKTDGKMAGICSQYQHDPVNLELACNKISNDQCGSITCCVLLGGEKCVAGDQYGPNNRANFTDPFLQNKDFYYYLGKCYGNCDKPFDVPIQVNGEFHVSNSLSGNIMSNIAGNLNGNMISGNIIGNWIHN